MKNFLKKRWDLIIKFLVFLIPLSIFTLTVSRFASGFSDSDELLLAGAQFSLAHPPGYSLTTTLLHLIYLLSPTHYAFGANFLSAIFTSLTSLFLYLILKKLIKKDNRRVSLLLALSSLAITFSTLIWQYANVWEVFSLHNLFLLFCLLLTLKITSKSTNKDWLLVGLTLGLGLAHHQLFILAIPAYLFILWPKINKKYLFSLIFGFLFAIIVYLGLIILQAKTGGVAWELKPGISGLWQFILRKDFAWGGYWLGFNFSQFWNSLQLGFFNIILNSLSSFIFILGLFGIYISYKSLKLKFFIPLFYLWLIYSVLLIAYLPFSQGKDQLQSTVINSRLYLSGLWLWGVWLGLAVFYLYQKNKQYFKWLILGLIFLVFWQLNKNFKVVNLANYRVANDYAENTLNSLPQKSVLVCFSDFSCFSLFYVQNVNKIRSDVVIIPITKQLQKNVKVKYPQLFKYNYPDQNLQLDYIIAMAWQQGYRVFLAEVSDEFAQQLQLSYGTGTQVYGNNWEIGCNLSNNNSQNIPPTKFKFSQTDSGKLHQQIIEKQRSQARQLSNMQNSQATPKPDQCFSKQELLKNIQDCQKANDQRCYYQNLILASMQEPEDKDLHLKLKNFYQQQGFIDLAKIEDKYSK